MATLKELAKKYFDRITKKLLPELEFEIVLKEINELTYTNGLPISKKDKAQIVLEIIKLLENKYSEYYNASGTEQIFEQQEIEKAFSNNNYLDLIAYIKTRTK